MIIFTWHKRRIDRTKFITLSTINLIAISFHFPGRRNRYIDVYKRQAQDKQFLYEYALLYNVTLKDYLEATGDMETVKDLWPVAKKQLDIVRTNVKTDGLMDFEKVKKDWWVFFDWKEDLYKEVPLQGVSILSLIHIWILIGWAKNNVINGPSMCSLPATRM